jgi:S-adenosylmethionine hydrolase
VTVAFAVLVVAGCAARRPPVVFLSDFGTTDDSVAICKGVMLAIEPRLQIVDLTHEVPPYAIAEGARLLADTAKYYLPGTVFLAVVDPGVGGTRRPIVAVSRGRGQYFVVPDNGLITLVGDRDGIRSARAIENPAWLGPARSATFHGRDVFAPAAAHLTLGVAPSRFGPPVADPVRVAWPGTREVGGEVEGRVIHIDRFGNLITSIDSETVARLARGGVVTASIGRRRLPLVRTYGDLGAGGVGALVGSRGRLEVAVRQGSAAQRLSVRRGARVRLSRSTRTSRAPGRGRS